MNILFIEQHPRFIGGSERISLSLCHEFWRRGHRTYLLYERDGNMVPAYAAITAGSQRAPVRVLGLRRPFESVRSLFLLGRLLRRHKIDVVFTSQINNVLLLALARRLYGVPSVIHLGLQALQSTRTFRWGIRGIAAAVTPSELTRQSWIEGGWPASTLHVVPNGVDLERFHPSQDRSALRRRIGLPDDRPVVAYVGRMVEDKGIFTLMRAAGALRRGGVSCFLVMLGFAPDGGREALRVLAANEGLDETDFSLREPTDSPESFYAAADVAAVPSECPEAFGLAAIEAMACGTIPVVSDVGILPDIVGRDHPDCVFPHGDAALLAERLRAILADPSARGPLSALMLSRVRENYSLSRCSDAYLQIMERCRSLR